MTTIGMRTRLIVSTHSRPKAAGKLHRVHLSRCSFQHTAARRRLAAQTAPHYPSYHVSTHSRPKAAGNIKTTVLSWLACFNTQPPEGGWTINSVSSFPICCFNTQPPEGGWAVPFSHCRCRHRFNTQPPEGGWVYDDALCMGKLGFQHTAARRRLDADDAAHCLRAVSTHSRPKAAGSSSHKIRQEVFVSTHSRPKAAGLRRKQSQFS